MCVQYTVCVCVHTCFAVCTERTNFFLLTVYFFIVLMCFDICMMFVCLRVCVYASVSVHCPSLPNDDVETKHFWPVYLPRCGDWLSGVTVVFCLMCVLSSTEQMALYGVRSYSILWE